MSDAFTTILIVGGTSGIGEGLARKYHTMGKRVIVTGRRLERLQALEQELPGLSIMQLDLLDLPNLPNQVNTLFTTYPTINAIFLSAGIQQHLTFTEPDTTKSTALDDRIITEITTNLTGPILFARALMTHLLAFPSGSAIGQEQEQGQSSSSRPRASIFFITSGLAFVPVRIFPLYSATKAGMHAFALALRAQMREAGAAVDVVEIVPPYVDTGLNTAHREVSERFVGKGVQGMAVEEFVDGVVEGLERREREGVELGDKHEGRAVVAVGGAKVAADKWVEAFGPVVRMFGGDV
ncbi:hypothetical protein FQN50_005554 [Emmonsiellopsis sp. PD_5]|nr:hypothetical protein FQN50_005554 [Emmonsiellopsis sp. PD_5]